MRGQEYSASRHVQYVSPEERVSSTHPLRPIRQYVDTALTALSPQLRSGMPTQGGPRLPRKNSYAPCCCRCSLDSVVSRVGSCIVHAV